MALTDKQSKFVAEYLVDLNATQAAIRAGYSEKTAYSIGQENLKKPEIAAEIEKRQRKLEEKTEITVEWVLNNFRSIAERCMQAEAITDRDGNPTGEYRFDSSGANKALENIGRYLGMFNDKLKVDASIGKKLEDML